MTFSKHNWNQLSESSKRELKLREAYKEGYQQGLNEQMSPSGGGTDFLWEWGPWVAYNLWGYFGRIRTKRNKDGTVTYEFDPPHPILGKRWQGPWQSLYDLLKGVYGSNTATNTMASSGLSSTSNRRPKHPKLDAEQQVSRVNEAYEAGRRQGLHEQAGGDSWWT